MPRIIDITVPPAKTDRLLAEIEQLSGLIGLRIHRDVSIQPPGDTITVESTTRSLHELIRLLERHGIGLEPGGCITTSDPVSVVSPASKSAVARDSSEATWEEMEVLLGKESNMTVNALFLMGVSGFLAGIGIATNAIHIAIAAMAIAPGFEPIVRVSLGIVAQSPAGWRGLSDTLKGYAVLVLGAVLAAVLLRLLGTPPLGSSSSYLPGGSLISYWTTIGASSLLVSAVAAAAGAVLVATNRSVLTLGAMIALSLIPTAAITGMALVSWDMTLLGNGLLRWMIDAGIVVAFSLLVFGWKRLHVHKRRMML